MTRRDRFELVVARALNNTVYDTALPAEQIVKLLRAEHRAMVRLVKQLCKQRGGYLEGVQFERGYRYACDDILRALAKRKGG